MDGHWKMEHTKSNGMMAINCHRVSSKSSMMEILQPLKKQTLIRQHMIKVMCLTMKIMHTSTSAETNVIK